LSISPAGEVQTVDVNREPDQYGSTDDEYDAMLGEIPDEGKSS